MTSLLKKEIQRIKTKCELIGATITIEQTKDDTSWTLSNFDTGKAIIIGEANASLLAAIPEEKHCIIAFKINVARWNWAIDEGFTRDEIVGKLSAEVFGEIDVQKVAEYLK